MQHNYLRSGMACVLATVAVAASAQVTPRVTGEAPEAGKQYILMNKAQKASQYMSRTSWDGALYFRGKDDSNYSAFALTAVDNGDGTWSFTSMNDNKGVPTETTFYMAIPDNTCNVNVKAEDPASWTLGEGDGAGFYRLTAGEGNNSNTVGRQLHLNKGGEYFVISEQADGGIWWPDIYGGYTPEDLTVLEDGEEPVPNDYISFNWAFVQPGNVGEYITDLEAVALINNLKANYCDLDDYAEGFELTYAAVAKIYEADGYDADNDLEPIVDMVEGKIALFDEIKAAGALNETDDAVLNAAIDAAKAVFDSQVDKAALAAAVETLKNAELAYSMGSGDITSLGQNMSFEDLSAQNGGTTTGVAGAPAGWNVYVNGRQVTTADEVKAAGIANWHGVNNESNGDIKDGQMAFGIWTPGVPEYEISQTIEGLENGTYVITAGLMAGSNGSGSRLTTQRLFGNLNSTYYASADDYVASELDATEVFAFADNEIIVTDTEMRPVTVRAYVYDGTLTFGLRTNGNYRANGRTASNGANGDGWFKLDNFTIMKEGYVADDAVAALDHFRRVLNECLDCRMDNETLDKLCEMVDTWSGIHDGTPQDEITAAILGARQLYIETSQAIKAYERLEAAIDQHENYLEIYENKSGVAAYAEAIDAVINGYDDGTISPAEVDGIIAGLDAALQACIQSDAIEPGDELTDYIKNASFEDLTAQGNANSGGLAAPPVGWNLYIEGQKVETAADISALSSETAWCAINQGDPINVTNTQGEDVTAQYTDGDHLWGIWSQAIPETELSQTITRLPAGTYTLSVDMVVQNDWAGFNLATQRLFANDYVCMFGAEEDYYWNIVDEGEDMNGFDLPADMVGAKAVDEENPDAEVKHLNYAGCYSPEDHGASSAPYTMTLTFGLAKAGDLTLGVRTNRLSAASGEISKQASMGWLKIDNFRLTYVSADIPAAAEADGISTVAATESGAARCYSIGGARLAAPQRGINIIRMADGTVRKVVVK